MTINCMLFEGVLFIEEPGWELPRSNGFYPMVSSALSLDVLSLCLSRITF